MKIPRSIKLTEGAYTLDGGSIHLFGQEPDGTTHHIALAQHRLASNFASEFVPGRLHLDGVPIPVRSDSEVQLVAVLRRAAIAPLDDAAGATGDQGHEARVILSGDIEEYLAKVGESPAAAIMLLLKRVLDSVNSDEYIAVAAKVETMEHVSSLGKVASVIRAEASALARHRACVRIAICDFQMLIDSYGHTVRLDLPGSICSSLRERAGCIYSEILRTPHLQDAAIIAVFEDAAIASQALDELRQMSFQLHRLMFPCPRVTTTYGHLDQLLDSGRAEHEPTTPIGTMETTDRNQRWQEVLAAQLPSKLLDVARLLAGADWAQGLFPWISVRSFGVTRTATYDESRALPAVWFGFDMAQAEYVITYQPRFGTAPTHEDRLSSISDEVGTKVLSWLDSAPE